MKSNLEIQRERNEAARARLDLPAPEPAREEGEAPAKPAPKRPPPPRDVSAPINHGTIGGYQTERRRGLPTCERCRAANAAAVMKYRKGL